MSRKAPYQGEIPKNQPPGPPGPPRRGLQVITIHNYGPKVILYKGHEIQVGETFEDRWGTRYPREVLTRPIKKGP